jgi:hypothetical protein
MTETHQTGGGASYEKPIRERFSPGPAVAFGAAAGTVSYAYIGPRGKRGMVRDITARITAAFVGTTSVPEITVGSAASSVGSLNAEYARFRMGTAAATGYGTDPGVRRASQVSGGLNVYEDFTGHVKLATAFIPADTVFVITLVEGDGGSEAGTAFVWVDIDWF